MNRALRNLSFVKTYINDVVIFSRIMKKHLQHLNEIFKLFRRMNITLKADKTYLRYSFIALLEQRVDSLRLITTSDKLETITKLAFSRLLKNLKTYLDVIDYLRDYISYYAQKADALQRRKTMLLKDDLSKRSSRRNFSQRILVKNPIVEELDSYNQLRSNFSRIS
jgi:sulfatase maturation enzyme AslB (radical SAM superfamily)